jgi:3',5'-cyclic AMP phosphodiesterase CpdA
MKLAHFSDIHVTHFPLEGAFALKRLAAVASYSLMGRGRHFLGSAERIAALLSDVDTQAVDHALCTGDLTGVSTEAEFAEVAQLWGERLEQPARFTCLPGNHDRYVKGTEGLFERYFGKLCEGSSFPFVKAVSPAVTIVGLDVARPTSVIDSSGLVGEAQRKRLLDILTDSSLQSKFVVLALHYGLLRAEGQRDTRSHGLRDDVELMALIDRADVTLDVVLHGHMHRPYVVQTKRRQEINAGSATDLHLRCGYNVYEIDPVKFSLTIARREWSPAEQRYLDVPGSPLAQTLITR